MVKPFNCKIMKKYFFVLAILALGLTACNTNEIDTIETPEAVAASTEAPVCYFNLPASFGGDADTKAVTIGEVTATSSFEASDKIYVFIEGQGTNAGKNAFGYNPTDYELVPLTISNINGSKCDLSGALKFYDDNGDPYTPVGNDLVYLYYNIGSSNFVFNTSGAYYKFDYQNGAKEGYTDPYSSGDPDDYCWGASHYDFAEAKMKVTAVGGDAGSGYTLTLGKVDNPTDTWVSFKNLQSMFRQRLVFTDKNSAAIDLASLTITKFSITSASDHIVTRYIPFYPGDKYNYDPFQMESPTITVDGDIYFALMFNDVNKSESLTFTAEDNAGNVYSCTKVAPDGGFANGKYYYGSAAMEWQYNKMPTITGPNAPYAADAYNDFNINDNPVNITVSGYSEGYRIVLDNAGTATLDNVTAILPSWKDEFIMVNGALELKLTGANSISGKRPWGIRVFGDLKLSCTGSSATLTLTCSDVQYCGLLANNYSKSSTNPNYNHYDDTSERDVTSLLAAPGYTVTRSARTDNADGTHTWTYTVTSPVGKVIGANGNIYDDADAATTAGTKAEAMIAYMGAIDGVCEHGLAISLTDIENYQMNYAQATGEYAIPVWAAAHPVAGGTWRLPSEADWQRMMWGYYTEGPAATDISSFQTKLSAAGGTALVDDAYYWTSTGVDTENAKTVLYDTPYAGIQSVAKTGYYHVRACLSF